MKFDRPYTQQKAIKIVAGVFPIWCLYFYCIPLLLLTYFFPGWAMIWMLAGLVVVPWMFKYPATIFANWLIKTPIPPGEYDVLTGKRLVE